MSRKRKLICAKKMGDEREKMEKDEDEDIQHTCPSVPGSVVQHRCYPPETKVVEEFQELRRNFATSGG